MKDTRVFRLKSDTQLKRDVREELEWDTRVDARGINVEVNNGVVTLAGNVPSYAAFVAAQKAAHRVAGVKDVANDLQVEIPEAQARTDTAGNGRYHWRRFKQRLSYSSEGDASFQYCQRQHQRDACHHRNHLDH